MSLDKTLRGGRKRVSWQRYNRLLMIDKALWTEKTEENSEQPT